MTALDGVNAAQARQKAVEWLEKVGRDRQPAAPGFQAVGRAVLMVTHDARIAAYADLLNVKVTTAYISQADMLADFGSGADVFLQLNLKPGAAEYPQFHLILPPHPLRYNAVPPACRK